MMGYSCLENTIGLSLEYAERRKFGGRPVFLIKTRKVKALMMRESLISDNLYSNEDMRCHGVLMNTTLPSP